MNWHRIELTRAHKGAGTHVENYAYIFANNVEEAFRKYQRMPGVKRSIIPNIFQLSENEANELERKIIKEKRVPLFKAKKNWY